jgi:hypothetical protein
MKSMLTEKDFFDRGLSFAQLTGVSVGLFDGLTSLQQLCVNEPEAL